METGQNNFSGILATKMEYIKKENDISYNSAFNHLILDIISNELKDDEVVITEKNILDKSGDGGLDIGFIDDSSNTVYLIQNKNYSKISPQQIDDSLNKLLSYIEKVKDGNFYEFNENVKNFSNKLKLLISDIENELIFKLIVNTSSKITNGSWDKINRISDNFKARIFNIFNKDERVLIDIEINGTSELTSKFSMINDEEGINDEVKLYIKKTGKTNSESTLTITDPETQSKTFLVVIDAVKFREFFTDLKYKGKLGSLYSRNVREYFKNKVVDEEINKTLEHSPEDFFILNNGITIIGKNVVVDGNTINITNMCIINGAQTTHLIGESTIDDKKLKKVSVFAKIIDISTFDNKNNFNEDEFINEISYASNNQKPVKKEDLITQNKVIINFVKVFNEMSKNISSNYSIQLKKSEAIKKELKNKQQIILTISSIIKDSLKFLLLMPGTAKNGYTSFLNADAISIDTQDNKSTILWIFKFLNPIKNENKFKYLCEFIEIKNNIAAACKQNILVLQNEMNKLKRQGLEPDKRLLWLNEFYNTGQNFLESLFVYSKIVLINNDLKRIVGKNLIEIRKEYDNDEFDEIIKKRININVLKDLNELQNNIFIIVNAYLDIFQDKLSSGRTVANLVKDDKVFTECALIFAEQYLTYTNIIYGKDPKIRNFFNKLFNLE